jgi:2',3'-cyclic-nucleotide 2'-phosphodiesterase (5'-nucleotidase family)
MKVQHLFVVVLCASVLVPVALTHAYAAGQTTADLSADRADLAETTFGDLVADALCDKAGVTIGFVGAVSFKHGTISAGPVTEENVASLLQTPDETWAVSELTGEQVKQAFERSVGRAPLPNGAFLQVSGVSVTYSPNPGPHGRVKTILVGTTPLNETQKYEVAMPVSLAKGGSGYFQIFDEGAIKVRGAEAISKVVADYVSARGTVSYTGQGRIRQQ